MLPALPCSKYAGGALLLLLLCSFVRSDALPSVCVYGRESAAELLACCVSCKKLCHFSVNDTGKPFFE